MTARKAKGRGGKAAGPVVAVALDAASGEALALDGGRPSLRRLAADGALVAEVPLPTEPGRGAVSPDLRRAAVHGADEVVRLFDARSGTQTHSLAGLKFPGLCSVFAPVGSLLIATDSQTTVAWDGDDGEAMFALENRGVCDVAVSPRGDVAATAGLLLRLHDLRNGLLLRTLSADEGVSLGVAFSPDGKRLASFNFNKGVAYLWDTGSFRPALTSPLIRGLARTLHDRVPVCFSPGGRSVWFFGSQGPRRWDLNTNEVEPLGDAPGLARGAALCGPQGALIWGEDGSLWRPPIELLG